MKILLAINHVDYQDPEKKRRQDTALAVLINNKPDNVFLVNLCYPGENTGVPSKFRTFRLLKRNSAIELGNSRPLPYVKDIFDKSSEAPFDIFGYINSDILLTKDFFRIFNDNYQAYIFYKRDIEEVGVTEFLANKIRVADNKPDGVDAFFFNTKWWRTNRNAFPDCVLGETEWDTAYNSIIQKVASNYYLGRDLYHAVHDRIWTIDSRGAIHNTLIWKNVMDKYGIPQFNPENKEQK